jgi:hypothetical protein
MEYCDALKRASATRVVRLNRRGYAGILPFALLRLGLAPSLFRGVAGELRVFLQEKQIKPSANRSNGMSDASMTLGIAGRAFASFSCELDAAATLSYRRPLVDVGQFANAIPVINNISTAAAIACVLPTYFLQLRLLTYRVVLSLGIVCAVSTLAIAIPVSLLCPSPHQYARFDSIFPIIIFSPFNVVLIAILAGIKQATRVGIWSTVVLFCVIFDWVGIAVLVLVLQP